MKIRSNMEANDVMALWEQMKSYESAAWAKMEDAQALYDHSFPELGDSVPEGVDVHEPSTASSVIDHFRDNIRVHNIVPEREDWGTSKKAREQKALLLRLDSYVLKKLRASSQVDPFVQTVFDMPLRGAACTRLWYNAASWPEVPTGLSERDRDEFLHKRSLRWPIVAAPIDPLDVAPAPGGEWPLPWLIHKRTYTCWETQQEYSHWLNVQNLKPGDDVEHIELWSTDWYDGSAWVPGVHKVVINGQFVADEENPYGVVPYVYEYSGLGRVDSSNDPGKLAVNMLEKAASELRAEARLKTCMDAAWQFGVFPRLLTTDDPRDLKKRWDLSSGGILQVSGLAPDQRPQWLEQPQLDAAMWSFLPIVQASIEKATFSSVLTGERQAGVDYGYLQSLLVGQASLRKDNVVGMAARAFARLVGLAERMMVKLQLEPIAVGSGASGERSRMVYTSDIGDKFDLSVKIEASDPAERDRKMVAWLAPLRARAISKRTYLREGLMVDDPDEELATIYAETVVEQIMASGLLVQDVLQSLQAENEADVLEQVAGRQFRDLQRSTESRLAGGLVPREGTAERPTGQPPMEQSPLAPSPLAVAQSFNRQATGLQRQG